MMNEQPANRVSLLRAPIALAAMAIGRYASVFAEAWQDNRDRPFAQASAHFVMPRNDG